jgi:hypothetical protein
MNKPKKTFTIIDAIQHKQVFGSLPAFSSLDSWRSWLTWLKAIHALPMDDSELAVYRQCTGRTQPPAKQPSEIYTICGRRSGKSFTSSLTAVYTACFSSFKQYLNAGERAAILVLARDRDQARIVFSYVSGIIHAVPALAETIDVERADEIELNNGVIIMVKTSDFRAIRGLTVAAAILDEVAFWDSEGVSPDREVLTALRPATSTIPGAKIIAISTPYSQAGSLYEAHKEFYGVDNDDVLVWQAPTSVMNPTIDESVINRALEKDPEAAAAEYLATFRTDVSAAFSVEMLEQCTVKGRTDLPASPIIEYRAFCDPSGGKADAFTLAIGHKADDKAVIDLVRAWPSPFNPKEVVAEIATALKEYGCLNVVGDRFAAEWPIAEFHEHGIAYTQSELNKSELYLAFVPVTNSGGVELPDDRTLFNQLRRLERKRGRMGRDTVDHPARLHDDIANAVAGISYLLNNAKATQTHSDFSPGLHIQKQPLQFVPGAWPIFVGLSCDENYVASVIAQTYSDQVRVFYAAVTEGMSLQRHLEECTKAWLAAHAPRQELFGGVENNADVNIRASMYEAAQKIMGGGWCSCWHNWNVRQDMVRSMLQKAETILKPLTVKPCLQFSPNDTAALTQVLSSGRYKEKTAADKRGYHVVNALSLLLARREIWKAATANKSRQHLRMPPSFMAM